MVNVASRLRRLFHARLGLRVDRSVVVVQIVVVEIVVVVVLRLEVPIVNVVAVAGSMVFVPVLIIASLVVGIRFLALVAGEISGEFSLTSMLAGVVHGERRDTDHEIILGPELLLSNVCKCVHLLVSRWTLGLLLL
jgi:hypothetical protein